MFTLRLNVLSYQSRREFEFKTKWVVIEVKNKNEIEHTRSLMGTKPFQTYLWERRTQGKPNYQELYQRVCSEECSHRHHLFLDRRYNRKRYIYIFPSLSPIPVWSLVQSRFDLYI